MRMPAVILTLAAATVLMAPVVAQDQKSDKRVKELQKERIATLKDVVEGATKLYQNARVDYYEVIDAKASLFKAQLDAAEKQADRVALCKAAIEDWAQFEKIAEARVNAGRGTKIAIWKFKAMRLEAEILLEQAQAKKSEKKIEGTSSQTKKPEVGQGHITATSPRLKNVVLTEQYACQIHAQRHITIRALLKGYLDEVPVKEGQTVKQGQLLFRILPTLYKARLDARLAEAKIAAVEFQNAERLFKNKVVSPQEVALYQARMDRTRAEVDLAKIELSFTEVRAPYDGIIDRLHMQRGSLVTDRDVLTTLSDNQVMWVYFNMPEARFINYKTEPDQDRDNNVELTLANGSKFKQSGKIGAIDAKFNSDNGTVPFRADFPNPDGLLRHGMSGNVLIHRNVKNAIVIPQRATFEKLDHRYVYVLDKDNIAHAREIVVQHEVDGLFVVSKGLGVSDKIIFEGIRQVHDGDKVEFEFRPLN